MPPKFEPGIGTVDGVNKTFFTSVPYRPGTLSYFLNGQLKEKDLADGWYETDPATGKVDLKEAPETGDIVQFYYIPAGGVEGYYETSRLYGRLRDVTRIHCKLEPIDPLVGRIHVQQLKGVLVEVDR